MRAATAPKRSVVSSKHETVLLSMSGDVLSCQCRNAPYPVYKWTKDTVGVLCCEADCQELSAQLQGSNSCFRGGLLGGSPAKVSPMRMHHDGHHTGHHDGSHNGLLGGGSPRGSPGRGCLQQKPQQQQTPTAPTTTRTTAATTKAQASARNRTIPMETSNEEDSIAPIQSFDYSNFYEGENDMLHPKWQPPLEELVNSQQVYHGVPAFRPAFQSIRVRSISAHPLGGHVLLISEAGLLYSYGLNTSGQLGIGIRSDSRRAYVMAPTIVTPLVENGGKALVCAAGVDNSLVVVETEQERLLRTKSLGSLSRNRDDSTSINRFVHHQLYGFGSNECMKLGLVAESVDDDYVMLPRRVALRCSARDAAGGIVAVEASERHSAALVRKISGDVRLYSWGSAADGALGLLYEDQSLPHVVPKPEIVGSLSKTSKTREKSLLLSDVDERPVDIALGRRCSFVVTSVGRCFAFGNSTTGMLGLGKGVTESLMPTEVSMPEAARGEWIETVSAGVAHVVVCTKKGNAFAWGAERHSGIENMSPPQQPVGEKEASLASATQPSIAWTPKRIVIPAATKLVEATAGLDCSFFVAESGKVYGTGKSSGRLGLGELVEDVDSPRALFGGLHLWKENGDEKFTAAIKARPTLNRGHSVC